MNNDWEEIHGFNSPGEYKRFCDYIEKQVLLGCAIERVADPNYEKGLLYGGRWLEERDTKEIWRLVPLIFRSGACGKKLISVPVNGVARRPLI
jgi:hypothetical protein